MAIDGSIFQYVQDAVSAPIKAERSAVIMSRHEGRLMLLIFIVFFLFGCLVDIMMFVWNQVILNHPALPSSLP